MPDVEAEKEKIRKASSESEQVRPLFQVKGQVLFNFPGRKDTVAKCLTFRECLGNEEDPRSFYVIFIGWRNNLSNIILLDNQLKIVSNQDYHGLTLLKTSRREFKGHILAYGTQQDLYAINTHYIIRGLQPQHISKFVAIGNDNIVMSVSSRNIWIITASGQAKSIETDLFEGRTELEENEENDYLVWKQHQHLLAAVNRFNVVSFWNTLTGRLVHKVRLEGKDRIADAHFLRSHDY